MNLLASEADNASVDYNRTILSEYINDNDDSVQEVYFKGKKRILKTIVGICVPLIIFGVIALNVYSRTPSITRDVEIEEKLTNSSNMHESSSSLSHNLRMQVLSYIKGIMDPLNENMNLSDEYLEEKAQQVWKDAEDLFGVTEEDIFEIMGDTDLMKEYYGSN